MSTDIRTDIGQFIVDNYLFGDTDRTPADTDSLMATGIIDSTGILELIEYLESRFEISISESETIPQNLDTLDNLVSFVQAKTTTEELSA